MEWEDWATVEEKALAATKEESTPVEELETKQEPTIYYLALVPVEVKMEAAGEEITVLQVRPLILYAADEKHAKTKGPAAEWLIDYLDEKCPNDKPLAELRPN